MSAAEIFRKQLEYQRRYELLGIKYPPLNAFVEDSLPVEGRRGPVFKKALALKREWSAEHWRMKNIDLTPEERLNCQVVVVPPRNLENKNKDFSEEFYESLKQKPLGKYPVARLDRQDYKGDKEKGRKIIGEKKVRSVYIVSSLVDERDILDVAFIASQYRLNNENVEINLVSPFIYGERDDKNVETIEKGKPQRYTGKIITIKAVMEMLSPFVNRIFTYETHSSAAQAFAAINGIDLLPISLQDELAAKIRSKIEHPDDWIRVRPDIGRNMVARRIGKLLNIKRHVNLSKFRKGDTVESEDQPLTKEEKQLLHGKNALLYDDEAGTFGTVKDVVIGHLLKANVKSINILLGHARLQKGWDKNLQKMIAEADAKKIPLKIYITDSRIPLSDLKTFMENNPGVIEIITVAEKTRKIIDANISGVDFFHDKEWGGIYWELSILQEISGYDFKGKNNGNGSD